MNIPLLCLPIALSLVFLPKGPMAMAMARLPGGYNNVDPRDAHQKLSGMGRRAVAAHANGWESFPAFAAGVLACEIGHGDPKWASTSSSRSRVCARATRRRGSRCSGRRS